MREIKFRAWDTKTKKMIFTGFHVIGEVTCFGLIDQYVDENRCGADTSLDRLNDIELMQYTGLKDCKGKEIYEGDIVEVRIDGMGTGHKHPVVWDNDDATYKFGHAMLGGSDVEIIGNIYENPELESE